MIRVIVAEDDPLAASIFRRMLGPEFQVASFGNGEEALLYFTARGADIILTDLRMPRMGGLELLAKVKQINSDTIVFIITGYSLVEDAVKAIKQGAYDYIAKPFDPDDVLTRINRALRERSMEEKLQVYEREREIGAADRLPVTGDPALLQVLELARKVARTDSTVLIQGETGTGKELVARMLHNWSPRREQPFVPVNCAALSEGVLESELFGHERGAFTGAVARRAGYFELAHRGTILLDEIGATTPRFQVKLLRVLQDRLVHRVGSSAPIPVDSRVIACTNQDLEKDARDERFRSDLYYRLSVVTLTVPPLRERRGDITLLADHFIARYRAINPRVLGVTPEALDRLRAYRFPGNVRELENIIERAMILESSDRLTPASVLVSGGDECSTGAAAPREGVGAFSIDVAERDHIVRILAQCNGRKMEAARLLGINKTTLWRKMKRFGMG
ncbi:MAG: sigma-54-dependent Fis family transcriptional regulator [Geobacteraceae bacterium GWC2_58_44]|nr:MAG: sigma-54-dependent Fis family transcriptional regulator [Geobacteraceae bacterium GWC2_58_44]HBG05270.1 sigma-54-dependent Fis family transcriptional regulator [Geobacter sp.]